MHCPDCGFTGIRAEFTFGSKETGWNHFKCPKCSMLGTKKDFTPRTKEAES